MSSGHYKHGFWSVLAALLWNWSIMILKFIGFSLSGSWTLFSEAIHSLADLLNQSLLLVGIKSSWRAANSTFSYGFGKERFLWALISACWIFFLGAGVTLYHGVEGILDPQHVELWGFTIITLVTAFVVESFTFFIAIRELRRQDSESSRKKVLRDGDPVVLAVVYEDGIAVLWVLVAMLSLGLYQITKNPLWDSVGSLVVWVLLAVMAIFLIAKNRAFLLGKAIPHDIKEEIIEMLEADPIIDKVLDFKSSILDFNSYHIKCEIECNGTALMKELGKHNFFRNEYEELKDDYQAFLEFCIDYTGRLPRLIGTRIDTVEAEIKKKFPQVKHIDLEIN